MGKHQETGGAQVSQSIKLRYAVVFEQTPNNYCAYAPDVPGCISTGKTWDKMLAMMREALSVHIGLMMEDGDPVPEQKMSLEDAMADYLEVVLDKEPDPYLDFSDETPPLSVTFQMVEIEVQVPVGARSGRKGDSRKFAHRLTPPRLWG